MTGQPPSKKGRLSTSTSTTCTNCGFTFLQEKILKWDLTNFKQVFLANDKNVHLIGRMQTHFTIAGLPNLPRTEWKVSLWRHTDPRPEYRDDWLISVRYELMRPEDVAALQGLFVNVQSPMNLKRTDWISDNFPDSSIVELTDVIEESQGGRNYLPLCHLHGRSDVLKVDWKGTLTLRIKFMFSTTNGVTPDCPEELEEAVEELKHKLRRRTLEDVTKKLAQVLPDDLTVVAKKSGERFRINRAVLIARSPYFEEALQNHPGSTITFDFSPAALGWLMFYIKTGELKPFKIKDDQKDDSQKDLPSLPELLDFADLFGLSDLMAFFDVKMSTICYRDPTLAPFLLELATEYKLVNAKSEIKNFIASRSNDKPGLMDRFCSLFRN